MANTPQNINLLPEVKVLKLRGARNKKLVTIITILTGLVFAGLIVGLLLVTVYYAAEGKKLKDQTAGLQSEVDTQKDIEQTAVTLQQHLCSYHNLNHNRIEATAVFDQLRRVIPPNVHLASFQLNSDYSGSISGITDSYKSLGTFNQILIEYNVTYKPQDGFDRVPIFIDPKIAGNSKDSATNAVTFSMSFSVNADVVKSNRDLSGASNTQVTSFVECKI